MKTVNTHTELGNSERWVFTKDDDGHTYLIPLNYLNEFNNLLESDEEEFIDKFDEMRVGCHMSCYSFINPQLIE